MEDVMSAIGFGAAVFIILAAMYLLVRHLHQQETGKQLDYFELEIENALSDFELNRIDELMIYLRPKLHSNDHYERWCELRTRINKKKK